MLTSADKKYIKDTIKAEIEPAMEKNRIQFRNEIEPFFIGLTNDFKAEFKRHTGALQEDFNDKFTLLYEMMQERPTRSEVKNMIDNAFDAHKLLDH